MRLIGANDSFATKTKMRCFQVLKRVLLWFTTIVENFVQFEAIECLRST